MNSIIRTTVAAIALISAGNAVAADEINRQKAASLVPSGYILTTPDEVANALKDKAEQADASYVRIISLNSKNKFYGTAVFYR